MQLDGNILDFKKDCDDYNYTFKIGGHKFYLSHNSDEKQPQLIINGRNFQELMNLERTGKLKKEKEEYLKNKNSKKSNKNINNEDDDYKLALKLQKENEIDGNPTETYDIELQRQMLEEFELKKAKEISSIKNNDIKENKKNDYILDEETVRKNKMIINNINNIFDDDNDNNILQFNFDDNKNNFKDNLYNINIQNNPDYYLNKMHNDLENSKNPNNIAIIDKFLNNNGQNDNMLFSNNNNYQNNFQNNYPNNFQNNYQNNYPNINNQINNQNQNYKEDFNPFDED